MADIPLANHKVLKLGIDTKRYRKFYCFTMVSGEVDYAVYNSDFNATYRAVAERVFNVKVDGEFTTPPEPIPRAFDTILLNFTQKLDALSQYTAPYSAEQFADGYEGRRRLAYINAAEKNKIYGFSDRFARMKPFVKCEKYNFTAKQDPVPRIIQPRNVRYIVETGRFIKPIEPKIYKNINKVFAHRVVCKGLNAEQRAQAIYEAWSCYEDPAAIGADASRFDQHVSLPALRWEHNRYKRYYRGNRYFAHLLRLQEVNRGYCSGKNWAFRYKIVGHRMSGDSNTSLGNVVIMCGMMHAFIEKLGFRCHLINDGDDCVIITERRNAERVSSEIGPFFRDLGFTLTVDKTVFEIEHIVFCQTQPVYDGTKYIMVRDPRVAVSKDALSLKPLNTPGVYKKWCAAVGAGGLSLTSGLPVWQSFYQYFVRSSEGANPLVDPTLEGGFFRLSKGMKRKPGDVPDVARFSFWKAFGIAPSEQLALEEYYEMLGAPTYTSDPARFTVLPLHC